MSSPDAGDLAGRLHEVFGYAHTEIAEILGRSPSAIRQLAHRAHEHVHAPDLGRWMWWLSRLFRHHDAPLPPTGRRDLEPALRSM
jgi:hypothetical protein